MTQILLLLCRQFITKLMQLERIKSGLKRRRYEFSKVSGFIL
jgi:hypothetical protein